MTNYLNTRAVHGTTGLHKGNQCKIDKKSMGFFSTLEQMATDKYTFSEETWGDNSYAESFSRWNQPVRTYRQLLTSARIMIM